jgi:phosphohistidine swiveling domain-containing protein
MLPALLRLVRFVWRESRVGRRVGPFLESQRLELDGLRALDWASQPPDVLAARFRRLMEIHADTQRYIIVVSANMLVRSRMLGRMIVRRWPGTDPRDVIKGYGRGSSLVPFEEIKALAEQARRLDRGLIERIAGPEEFDPAAALASAAPEAARELAARFGQFMNRFGFLSANGSDFSEMPWVENPRSIWRTVARLALHHDHDSTPSPADAEAHREEVLALVRAGFGPVKRRLFDRLHRLTVRFMDWRERVSLRMTEDSYLMRRCLLALGAKLVERGTVAEAGDVFFLYENEIERVLADPAEAAAAAARIRDRKAELERDAALDPPDTLCGGELAHLERPTAEGLEFLSGIGASGGVVKGRVRVVHDPALVTVHLGAGDVLVVPFTDVGWTPILALVGGVVADTGGQLSHTSIIAREYGIPAVVGVRNATRLLRDGQLVTVDGTAGRIYPLPDEPA